MKTQALILSLSALALCSSTAAKADTYITTTGYRVLTYPAVVTTSAACAAPLTCEPLFGSHTWYDNGPAIRSTGLLGMRSTEVGVREFSAVVPNECGVTSATKVCGQKLSNSLFDIRLFGFGLGFGRVAPHLDARPAGLAL